MKIGLAKEIKTEEYRVGLTPALATEYIKNGHQVMVEKDAGIGSGFSNEEYQKYGCTIIENKQKLFDESEMIIKVKEPLEEEFSYFHAGQILFTYLHLAANKPVTEMLLNKNVTGVAYETVMEDDGSLPLLKPMSEIAGRLSIQEATKYIEKPFGGRGILLGGIPGIRRGKVTIIGGGIAGINACKIAVGIGADVTVLDISNQRLTYFDDVFGSTVTTLYSNEINIRECLQEADVVIGAVLIPGASAPKLIKKEHLKIMKHGAVLVDIAIDQGGCFETSKPTTHQEPTYIVDGIVHYCVANMPGVVALSSTNALSSVTHRYGVEIANKGIEECIRKSKPIREGVNTFQGKLMNEGVSQAIDIPFSSW